MRRYLFFILATVLLFGTNYAKEGIMAPQAKSGKTVYGFCYHDGSWGATPNQGLYSFNTASLSSISKQWGTTESVEAGAYYDGYYYVQTSTSSYGSYTSMSFGKLNAVTGEYTKIADWSTELPRFKDLTIDYSTTPPTLMGLKYLSSTSWRLVKVDMQTGAFTNLASSNSSGQFVALACNLEGVLYSMNLQGRLQTINKKTGATTNVSAVANSFMPYDIQSMDFDHTDGTLYWAMNNFDGEGKFGTINLTTGLFESLGILGANSKFAGLYIPFRLGEIGAPGCVTDFTLAIADNGEKKATLSWKNPTVDNMGSNLTSITAVKVYRNDELITTFDNPSVGSTMNYIDTPTASGVYTYKITAENNNGVGALPEYVTAFLGEDIPQCPTNVVLTKDAANAVLNWTAPTIGLNQGWINTNSLKYKIVRNPGNTVIADNIVENTYVDNTIPILNNYSYTVHAKTDVGTGGSTTSNIMFIGNPLTLPYSTTFTIDQFALWTVVDANADAKTWGRVSAGVQYTYHSSNNADDYLISPSLFFPIGQYRLAFDYKASNANNPERLKVFLGNGATADSQTTELKYYSSVNNTTFIRDEIIINITTEGIYNFSFYACSEKDKYGITVHNVDIEALLDNDMKATAIAGDLLIKTGTSYKYSVTVKNNGLLPQSSYKVQLVDESDMVLAETIVIETIAPNATKVVDVNWTPNSAGVVKLRGKAFIDNDQSAVNNYSVSIKVDVLSNTDGDIVSIGNPTSQGVTMPIVFNFKTSATQILYFKDEIGADAGMVKKIIYPYQNDNLSVIDKIKPIKVYMANTSLANLSAGWIPQEQFIEVYNGTVMLQQGANNMVITLDTPFIYTGENVCIMCVRPLDDESFVNFKYHLTTTTTERSRLYQNGSIEFDYTAPGTISKVFPKTILQIDTTIEIGRPNKVTALTVTPGLNGTKTALIEWTNPLKDTYNSPLTKIDSVLIYRNNVHIKTINTPEIGSQSSYLDTEISTNGICQYKVVAENNSLVGAPTVVSSFVGEDITNPPTAVSLVKNESNAILTWAAPTSGVNNGWIDNAAIRYTITRNPDNVVVAQNIAETSFTDTGIASLGRYSYAVQAVTSAGESKAAQSVTLILGPSLTLPYNCDFSTSELFDLWTVIDANNDEKTWESDLSNKYAKYSFSPVNSGDDWLISPPVLLAKGKYKLSFEYKSATASATPERMKVKFGQGVTPAQQATTLKDYPEIKNITFNADAIEIDVTTEGSYNFSFYAYSPANVHSLMVDNVKLEMLFENDLEAVSVEGEMLTIENTEYTYNVKIVNRGYAQQTNYTLQLIDDNNNVLTYKDITTPIDFNQVVDIPLKWTPNAAGIINLRAKVILNNDAVVDNNISTPLRVDVQPEINKIISIGSDDEEFRYIPFNFHFKSSVAQTIYLKSEIGQAGGLINKIVYHYNNANQASVIKPVRIYMANTAKANTASGWIEQEQFTKVFEGLVTINKGVGELIITLDLPFLYTGSNICIMDVRPMDNQMINNVNWYVTSTSTDRSIQYNSDHIEFNPELPGTKLSKIPNIKMQIDVSKGGKIEGYVKSNNTPIANAKVTLSQHNITVYTDAQGKYTFNYVSVGNYNLTVSKYQYEVTTSNEIVVIEGQTTNCDVNINMLPRYTVSGIVKSVDGNGVNKATVRIEGYATFETLTAIDGTFSIPGVYKANDYTIKVSKKTMSSHTQTFNVVDADINIPAIVLTDVPNMPLLVKAVPSINKVDLSWIEPTDLTLFRYDNGTILGGLGIENGSSKALLGAVHQTPTVLESMTWQTLSAAGGTHSNVNIFVIDLQSNGYPTSKVLFNQNNVSNTDNEWTSFKFPTPIECPNGFMIAISYSGSGGYVGLGYDSGIGLEYPFAPNSNFYTGDYTTGSYVAMSGLMSVNFAIRANGFVIDESSKANTPYNDLAINQLDIVKESLRSTNNVSDSKSLKGYKVWRLSTAEESNPDNWTLLTSQAIATTSFTDNDWESIPNTNYKYAVKAVFSNDVMSEFAFSKTVTKTTQYLIRATAGDNGTITPAGEVIVNEGSNKTFTMKPNKDFVVDDVLIDGVSIGDTTSYTFENVVANHSIHVVFRKHNGVEQVEAFEVRIYPNPVKDIMNIDGDYDMLYIYDAQGKQVMIVNSINQSSVNKIDVSHLAGGVYTVRVQKGSKTMNHKIVK